MYYFLLFWYPFFREHKKTKKQTNKTTQKKVNKFSVSINEKLCKNYYGRNFRNSPDRS